MVEQSFEFDLTSTQKLLSRYLDREITVEQARGQGVGEFTGTLVGTQGGLTLKNADGSVRVVAGYAGIKLPGLPGGLIAKPTLVGDIDTAIPGPHQARVSYLYTLGRPASLPQNATKQIELFPTAAGVGCEKKLVYVGQGALPVPRRSGRRPRRLLAVGGGTAVAWTRATGTTDESVSPGNSERFVKR